MKRIISTAVAVGAVVALTACSGSTGAEGGGDEKVFRVATTSDSKPYAYSEDGVFKGFDLEIMDAIAEAEGAKTEYVAMDFTAILPSVNNGQTDIGANSIAVTDERKESVDFSDPYFVGYISILAKDSSGLKSEDDLDGKRLGLIQGTIHETYANDNLDGTDIVRFPDNNAGFSALQSGTIDAQFLDLPVANDYIDKNPDAGLKIIAEIPTLDMPAAFVTAKGDSEMLETINSGLESIMLDGTWLDIYTKYFPDQPVPEELLPEGAPTSDTEG